MNGEALTGYWKHIGYVSRIFAKAEFKIENEGTVLGYVWYIVNPLLIFSIFFIVFSQNFGSTIKNYPLFLLLGIIVYSFFRNSISANTRIFYNNRLVIKSINFPLQTLVLGSILKTVYVHFFEISVFVLFMIISNTGLVWIIAYPILFILLFIFTIGVANIVSVASVYIRDIEKIWAVVAQALLFITPIFYDKPTEGIISLIVNANPLTHYLEAIRNTVLYGIYPTFEIIILLILLSITTYIVGNVLFNRFENKVVEYI